VTSLTSNITYSIVTHVTILRSDCYFVCLSCSCPVLCSNNSRCQQNSF